MDNTLKKVKSILAKRLGFSEDQIEENSKLVEDLQADSLDTVEIVMAIEDEFQIDIHDKYAEQMKTVKDIVDFLQEINNN